MNSYLNQSYPFTTYHKTHKRSIFFSLFVTIFLLIFRPFGLNVYSYERSYIIIGYGLIILISLSITDFLAYRFLPGIFSEKKWTITSQITWTLTQLFITGITCFVYAIAIDAFPQNLLSFIKIELYVLLSSVIPIVMIVLLKQNYLLKQNTQQAILLNKELQEVVEDKNIQDIVGHIVFTGDNQNEQLSITTNQIHYITSQDNYIEIVWIDGQKINKRLLRGTLAKAEESVKSFPFVFRCHRAYIVNLKKVEKIEGNAQGYRLKLHNNSEIVPVSRSKGQQLHQQLQSIS